MGVMDKARGRHRQQRESANGHSDAADSVPLGLVTTQLDTIKPEPIRWLVPGYLPAGKVVLLAGDGGNGKSALTLGLAADITRGWPCLGLHYDSPVKGEVLLVSCEDDYADTVAPRLLSAGADLKKIHRVDGVQTKDGKTLPFCLAHYEQLAVELKRRPKVRLIVIDPAGAYIGRTGVDDHKDSELRSLLDPLAGLSAEHRVTIIIVKHLNKGTTVKAVHKVAGSAGYVNAVRAAFIVCPDADVPDRKLFLPLKFNIGRKPSGLAYQTDGLDLDDQAYILEAHCQHLDDADRQRMAAQLFKVRWQGPVDIDTDDAVAAIGKASGGTAGKVDEAAAWLREYLADYALPSNDIIEAGREAGFGKSTLFSAKQKLNIQASNLGLKAWYWGIGPRSGWRTRTQDN